ncbi:cytochrome b5-like heme/steroid binding domain-containing protein [Gilbertella persicaria]|uniref:cytochrome b5-like heme/steroid binding domain-containing protein n=1 Tax=Gilbertella persicaria TaxID=101096 RepID=UPI00221F94BA|nr:cytochrome b5-like heme/steroid binding domain-containing protein [Gilbertella persicaria]KAI8084398.1 cytochrome b5-like heme/steroid binding domain-containing protein [Gilbertella persicaria]
MVNHSQQRLEIIKHHFQYPNEYTAEQVAQHTTEDDCWLIINDQVIDATQFLSEHPGGKRAILLYAGKNASKEFSRVHMPHVIHQYAPTSIIGVLKKK